MPSTLPKLALYWGASCGGCEVAFLNLDDELLKFVSIFDFVFSPCLLDTKRSDIEALEDGSLFLTLFNGGIRTRENLEMASLLRRKSKLLVAFGSCAESGGVPALANQHDLLHLLERVYDPTLSGTVSFTTSDPPDRHPSEAVSELPPLLPRVYTLDEIVAVDYTIPGCPPEPEQISSALQALTTVAELPTRGTLFGCSSRALCDECPLEKRQKLPPRLVRTCEIIPEPDWCLSEQGIACMGSATRGGCGALCPRANMPCTGCYGVLDSDNDPGAPLLTATAASISTDPSAIPAGADPVMNCRDALNAVADPLGAFYCYTLANSVLRTGSKDGR